MATMQTNVINNIPEVLNHTLFPITLVSITILFLVYHESTNQWINNLIGYEGDSKTTDQTTDQTADETSEAESKQPINSPLQSILSKKTLRIVISLLPIICLIYLDMNYSLISMKKLHVTKLISYKEINSVLRLLGAYGIIQIFAQDSGIKTGTLQRDLMQIPVVQGLMFMSAAFAITNNRSEALIGTLLYFYLKLIVSQGKTSAVCFEDV